VAQTVSILRGLRERYELHHGVRISDSALVEAAVLSDRYLADRWAWDREGTKGVCSIVLVRGLGLVLLALHGWSCQC